MKRNEFLRSACSFGICSCASISLLPNATLAADSDEKKRKEQDWRIGFIQRRFAKLLEGMNSTLDEQTRIKILEGVGQTCAKENSEFFTKFKDNPEGFLEELKQKWAENTSFDKSAKTIRVIGKKQESCFCPFVDESITPKDFCNCSIGFNKESFEMVLGKSVDVKIEESILRGGERCIFIVRYD